MAKWLSNIRSILDNQKLETFQETSKDPDWSEAINKEDKKKNKENCKEISNKNVKHQNDSNHEKQKKSKSKIQSEHVSCKNWKLWKW